MAESRQNENHEVGSQKLCAQWQTSILSQLLSKKTNICQYKPSLKNWKSVGNWPRVLHHLHLPIARMNACLVEMSTTRVTKPAVSRLISEIQHLSHACACSIGNELHNMLVFPFFDLMHWGPVRCIGSVTLCHP